MSTSPEDLLASIRETDPDVLDSDGLDVLLRRISELRSWCDARQVRATRRQRQLASEGRAGDPRGSLSNHGRQSGRDAAAAADREQVCSTMPGFERASAAGDVSSGHVDAIATATKHLDDEARAELTGAAETLLQRAKDQSVDGFGRECRDLAESIRSRQNERADVDELEQQRIQSKITRWVDRQTGMHKTLVECDPVTDRVIWAGIQRERARLRRRQQANGTHSSKAGFDRLQVDALASAVSTISGGAPGLGTLAVHIDVDSLTEGRHEHTLSETDSGVPVPIDVARRLACEAAIIPVVLDGRGVVLDEGRAKRLATREQRVAIEAMQASCSHPDCSVSIDECRIHHLRPWSRGGRTDLADLAPVCETHHHLVHEGGWELTMTNDRVATWTRPDGTIHWMGPVTDRRAPIRRAS